MWNFCVKIVVCVMIIVSSTGNLGYSLMDNGFKNIWLDLEDVEDYSVYYSISSARAFRRPTRLPQRPTTQPPPQPPPPTRPPTQPPTRPPTPQSPQQQQPPTPQLPPPIPQQPPPTPQLPPLTGPPPPPIPQLPPPIPQQPPPTPQLPPLTGPPTPQLPPPTWRPFSYPSSLISSLTGFRRHMYEDAEARCLNNETCIRKCCLIGQGFDLLHNKCRAIPDQFNPPVWKIYSLMIGFNASKEFHILKGKIDCRQSLDEEKQLVTAKSRHYLQSDGTLLVEDYWTAGPQLVFNTTKYCIDWFITAENNTEWNAFICHVKNDYETHLLFYGSCMVLTCSLILLRVILFAWVPELRTLHGIILMAYLISFLVGNLLMGSKFLLMYEQNINRETCVAFSFIIYFSILSAFFWRNVMCYDIWRTFSGKRAIFDRGSVSRTRLCLYCTYAFGGPTALTTLLAALEFSNLPREHALIPKLRLQGCNSLYGYSKLLYYYGPMITLFVINMVLFTLTTLKIAAIKKETKNILYSKESGTHDRKNDKRFTLYVKLFAAMVFLEVNWFIEIVNIFYPDNKIIVKITDMYDVVILLAIFLSFLCQKQTWILIKKRYKQISLNKSQTTSGQTSGVLTSHTLSTQISQSQDDTYLTDYSREKVNATQSQDNTIPTDYSREMENPAQSQDNTQLRVYSQEKVNLAQSQDDTQSADYSREKVNLAQNQDDTQSADYIQEKVNPAQSQDDTQSTDYSREKVNPAQSQDDTPSTDYGREKVNPAQSQDDTIPNDYSLEKVNPTQKQDDFQSTDYCREKVNLAQSQDDTQSADYSREKVNHNQSQDHTQSYFKLK